jgi:hypothetical protein
MTDLGFGLADRRSVIVILFTLLLSSIVFGYPFPVDTSSIVHLFIGLSLLTGFIYLARSLSRFLLLTSYFIIRFAFALVSSKNLRHAFLSSYGNAFVKPLLTKDWNWKAVTSKTWNEYRYRHDVSYHEWEYDLRTLGILDRLCLITIGVIACIPSFNQIRDIVGYLGMGVLILIYVITGHFSLVVKDALKNSEEAHDELVEAARSYPDVVYTKEARNDYGSYNR